MKPILVLGLGNDIVTDDGLGPAVVAELHRKVELPPDVEAIFAPLAGFALLDLMKDRQAVLIVDAILSGEDPPGTMRFFPSGHLTPTQQLTGSHQITLPVALEMGKKLGYEMPERIDILTVEAADVQTIGEQLTREVAAAIEPCVERIVEWLNMAVEGASHERRETISQSR